MIKVINVGNSHTLRVYSQTAFGNVFQHIKKCYHACISYKLLNFKNFHTLAGNVSKQCRRILQQDKLKKYHKECCNEILRQTGGMAYYHKCCVHSVHFTVQIHLSIELFFFRFKQVPPLPHGLNIHIISQGCL